MLNYSDEIINAFIDGELDGLEKEKFIQDMRTDEQLENKVRTVCELKKTIKSSYDVISLPESSNEITTGHSYLKLAAVAVLVLCMGYFLGMNFSYKQVTTQQIVQQNDEVINGIRMLPVDLQQPNKIILHVSSSDPEVLYTTLYKIDTILDKYKANNLPFELEVIANSSGIDFFRKDVSPYKNRITQIAKEYKNVSFIACTNAIEKLRLRGIEPDLIAETKIGVTAIEQIVLRLQQGWVYLKV